MGKGLFISGTGTGIGKTALSLAVVHWGARKGLRAAYFKPVQCGLTPIGPSGVPGGDADWVRLHAPGGIAARTGFTFHAPVSPHLATEREGRGIDWQKLRGEVEEMLHAFDLVVVEGAGGVAVPINRKNGFLSDLARDCGLPVLLACAPGLGTISHSIAAHAFLLSRGIVPAAFCLCHTESGRPDIVEDNARIIAEITSMPCWGELPHLPELSEAHPGIPAGGSRTRPTPPRMLPDHWPEGSMPGLASWWRSAQG